MSKFCENCGQPISAGGFCQACGAKVEKNSFLGSLSKGNKLTLAIAGGILGALLIVTILILAINGSTGPKAAINTYIDVIYYGEVSKVKDLMPQQVWDALLEESDTTMDEFLSEIEPYIKAAKEQLDENYDSYKVTATVNEIETLDKEQLNIVKSNLNELYGIDKGDVKEIANVKYTLVLTHDGETSTQDTSDYFVKIGSKWYMCKQDGDLKGLPFL